MLGFICLRLYFYEENNIATLCWGQGFECVRSPVIFSLSAFLKPMLYTYIMGVFTLL